MKDLTTKSRIQSIDILRGLAMVIMALDHTRDFFHVTANTADPLDPATTTPFLYFTRWITHYCAPTFVFFSGTSIFLQSLRKTTNELGTFLIKRGLWLILMEWTIVAFGWTFDPHWHVFPFQVIWAIGSSMVIMGLLVLARIPFIGMLIIGLLIVCGHNMLDYAEQAPGFKPDNWWKILHFPFQDIVLAPGHIAFIPYNFPAWTGIMLLGYCAGIFFTSRYTESERGKFFSRAGLTLVVLFFILRFINHYGNWRPWNSNGTTLQTVYRFFDVEKYPPSLMYFCMTIGPVLLLVPVFERIKNGFTNAMNIFGRTAFFYYILHIYLIHLLAVPFFFARGHSLQEVADKKLEIFFNFVYPGEGFGLPGVYITWIIVIIILYPLCKAYNKYKTAHPEKKWLSYL